MLGVKNRMISYSPSFLFQYTESVDALQPFSQRPVAKVTETR